MPSWHITQLNTSPLYIIVRTLGKWSNLIYCLSLHEAGILLFFWVKLLEVVIFYFSQGLAQWHVSHSKMIRLCKVTWMGCWIYGIWRPTLLRIFTQVVGGSRRCALLQGKGISSYLFCTVMVLTLLIWRRYSWMLQGTKNLLMLKN